MFIVDALRCFWSTFRTEQDLIGISRVLEHFSQRYCATNPLEFLNEETALVLAIEIVLLNTSLHNANVRPTTKQDYITNPKNLGVLDLGLFH